MSKKLFNLKQKPRENRDTLFKKMDLQKSIVFRLQIFGLVMVLGLSAILFRFYQIQIVKQEYYQQSLDNYTRRLYNISAPRGEIMDRNMEMLVTNQEQLMITFLPPLNLKETKKWELAQSFAEHFDMEVDTMSQNLQKEAYLFYYFDSALNLINPDDKEKYIQNQLSKDEVSKLIREVLDEVHLVRLSDKEKADWLVKNAMDQPSGGRPKPIKENASKQEVAYLMEHLDDFPGFDIQVAWLRNYPYERTLRTVLGSISTQNQGVPAESVLSYLALDYARNDSVGRSGLELQYEDLLKGNRSVYNLSYDDQGVGILDSHALGKKGLNLVTSFDINWQKYSEAMVESIFEKEVNNPYRKYMKTINFVVTDVNSGDVLVMVNVNKGEEGYTYDPLVNIFNAIPVGSSIKSAVLYMGLKEGVVKPNEVIVDQPIKIKDTPLKKSFVNLGPVNDLLAISRSSNVYMFFIAMRLGGARYVYDGPLNINPSAFSLMRNYFSQFGLGTYTHIDLPNEQTGYKGVATQGGLLLDYAIGQYDNYTPIQMVQYASTIASDGKRIAPRVVLEARDPLTDSVAYLNEVNVISQLDDLDALKRVQDGMRLCVTADYCRSYLSSFKTPLAAKTGTAEAFISVDDKVVNVSNSTLVGYAPFDKPEIAFACQVPSAINDRNQANICLEIAHDILRYRYE